MTVMTARRPVLVGREAELARLVSTADGSGPRYAVLTAGPGMGKTSVITALLEEAGRLPVWLLRAGPGELEATLGLSALGDLLADVDEQRYDALPGLQRTALRAALLLEDTAADIDPRAVAAALRSVLRGLAEERPVVVVIDDAHWLDGATAHALGHALHRTANLPVRVVAATRPTGRSVEEWLPRGAVDRQAWVLAPLAAAALGQVIHQELGISLDRVALREVHRVTGGNPLFALEVARHRGGADAGTRTTFQTLLAARLAALPRPTRLALLTAALAGEPTVEVVAGARGCDPGALMEVLEPAVAGGLVAVTDLIRFGHPLYASSVIASSAAADVRDAHTRLVDVDLGEEVRARHRGLAATGVDAALATRLDTAAHAARARGAWDTADELLRLAIEHSPEGEDRAERAATLGVWLARGGRPDEAMPWLRRAWTEATGPARWQAALERRRLVVAGGSLEELAASTREFEGPDVPLVARAEAMLMTVEQERDLTHAARADRVHEVNAQLAELAEDPEARRVRVIGLLVEADLRATAGQRWRPLVDEALVIEQTVAPAVVMQRAEAYLANEAVIADRHDEARTRLLRLISLSEELADDVSLPLLLEGLAWLEFRAGHWDRADQLSAESRASASGQHQHWQHQSEVSLAATRGMRGDTDGALDVIDRLYAEVAHPLHPYPIAAYWAAKGDLLQAAGRPEDAYAALRHCIDECERLGWQDPGVLHAHTAYMECAITLGRLDEAATWLGLVEERAGRCDRPAVLAACQRIRVLHAAARGDHEKAVTLIPEMLAAHESGVPVLQRAHAHFTAGRVYRRARAKTRAHEALRRAVRIYDELGAVPYAERARAELARVGLRHRAPDELTDTERQVAELAAAGLRNREIAQRTFLSPKTVEAVLGRVYRKLGIRSRAELGRALGGAEPAH